MMNKPRSFRYFPCSTVVHGECELILVKQIQGKTHKNFNILAEKNGKNSIIIKGVNKYLGTYFETRKDYVLVSTKEHISYIKELPGCSNLDIDYLPQYANTIFEESNFGNEDNGVIDLMFAGNIGKAQSVDTIIRAAALFKDDPRLKFHLVGSGIELENIKKLATELKTDNVVFYGQRPLEDMPELYKVADAMLVTLEDKPYANLTIPGKAQSYMAAGKPIIGAVNGSANNFIVNNKIGFTCPSGDYKKLAAIIKGLNIDELKNIGNHSREVYFSKYSKTLFMEKLITDLEKLAK